MRPAELRERRAALRLTQAELGRSLGVSRNTIARWERGALPIEHPALVALALNALGGGQPARARRCHNLPAELSSFIGRELETAELLRLLPTTRLLTLTGPGGIGKTRLALRLAMQSADRFPDGAWLAEFGPLNDAALVPSVVASALEIDVPANRPVIDVLRRTLRQRSVLLVFDNCEHLIEACAELANELLRAVLDLRIVVTSREPLRIPGEVTWPVPPMSLASAQEASLEAVATSDAVRLFVDRARAAAPISTDSLNGELPAVADVCRRLDGIPLAIELAATRLSTMSVGGLAASLNDRFRLLSIGPRTAPARQRTLRATVEWSYALLSPAERQLLAAVSVFAGGWSLDAARSVCHAPHLAASDIVDLHDALAGKSMIVRTPEDKAVRFRLLETMRAFASECLEASGQAEMLRAQHAAYYLDRAEEAGNAAARGPERIPWLMAIEREYDNMRAALRWTVESGHDAGARVRWAAALGPYWHLRGHLSEGRAWQAALGVAPGRSRPTGDWGRALTQTGILHRQQGAMDLALACFQEAEPIARTVADSETLMRLLINIGEILTNRGDPVRGAAALEEALAISRRTGDRVREAFARECLAVLWQVQGDARAARAQALASLEIAAELNDPAIQSDAQRILGNIALSANDLVAARAWYEASLSHARRAGHRANVTRSLIGLGHQAFAAREWSRARTWFAEGLTHARELGLERELAAALAGFAALAAEQGEASAALRLAATAERLCEGLGVASPGAPSDAVQRALVGARRAVPRGTAAEATQRGRTEPVEDSIAGALALEPRGSRTRSAAQLTPREQEVAKLIVEGLTNREIGDRLVITQRTTATHVEHILDKLNLRSRLDIALWMVATSETSADKPPFGTSHAQIGTLTDSGGRVTS